MSILKSIMHHWNKTTNSYDTLHPETESAQITDWHSGIMSSLASKTLGTVVDAITTDSVLGQLLKMVLTASGVKYNIATNGYICFGSFFGGLIIQWGTVSMGSDKQSTAFTYPITFPKEFISAAAADTGGGAQGFGVTPLDNQHANIFRSGKGYDGSARLIIIGR